MSRKNKYFEIFGLTELATKDEIRRAYRKLAMKYHPDKNPDPKAHQTFIDLAEAYDILINDKIVENTSKLERKEKSFEERKKEAEIRFKKQKARQKREEDIYFKKLTNGRKFYIFKKFTQISALFSFLLILDFFLPSHYEKQVITQYSPLYNGLFDGQVICFTTNSKDEFFVKDPISRMYTTHPEIVAEKSWIFHNPIHIWHKLSYKYKSFDTDFSVLSGFPLIPLAFLIPIITLYFRQKSHWFTIFYLFSFYFVGIFAIYFILFQDRWIHLLTLGFL